MFTGMAILRIKTAFNDDIGKYTCVARNIAGEDSTTAQLLVQQTPGIDDTSYINPDALKHLESGPKQPVAGSPDEVALNSKPWLDVRNLTDQTCREGETVSFICEIRGNPKPEVCFRNLGKVRIWIFSININS